MCICTYIHTYLTHVYVCIHICMDITTRYSRTYAHTYIYMNSYAKCIEVLHSVRTHVWSTSEDKWFTRKCVAASHAYIYVCVCVCACVCVCVCVCVFMYICTCCHTRGPHILVEVCSSISQCMYLCITPSWMATCVLFKCNETDLSIYACMYRYTRGLCIYF
jgi:hypothetical protein